MKSPYMFVIPSNSSPMVSEQHQIYAIGDIHGRSDLLIRLFDMIDTERCKQPDVQHVEIYMGDYIDRGPSSAKVIDCLIQRQTDYNAVCLSGNHELYLTNFLNDAAFYPRWKKLGGAETLVSYGVMPPKEVSLTAFQRAQNELKKAFSKEHQAFWEKMLFMASFGDYVFVHAGIRPNIPLSKQNQHDLVTIRHEFLDFKGRHEKMIIHGHTPVQHPDVHKNRINIDTGAFMTGKLTCLVLQGTSQRFIQT